MSTLADITRQADVCGEPLVDDDTPAGHFLVTARVLGVTMTYLVDGDTADAQIIGRIEYPSLTDLPSARPTAYKGNRLRGGEYLSFTSGQFTSAEMFRRMV
jgi:hypothetical protein